MMALERGIHVVLDKPMTFSLEEAKAFSRRWRRQDWCWH